MSTLKELMAVSGLPGLYRMVGNRSNGLIAEDLDTGKRKFLPLRKHQFSPLETISVYTQTDATPLLDVLLKMDALSGDLTPPPPKSEPGILREYFEEILPEHDEMRVSPRDIQKIIKWYLFLKERELLQESSDEEE